MLEISTERKTELMRLHREMLLIRRFEEEVAEQYTRAKVAGFLHLNIGEEATIVGTVSALRDTDYLMDGYREHGHALAKGMTPRSLMAELFGRETGCSRGRGGSMHLFDLEKRFLGGYAIVGGQLPLAVGVALGIDYLGTDDVMMCLFGDGASNIGAFHEALNLSGLWDLPVVWVVVNNQYGMGTSVERASAITDLWKKAEAYGFPGVRVDGMDVLAVREVADVAVERARRDHVPTLIEAVTYRYRGHSMADPGRYRKSDEVREWRKRDAIASFEDKLIDAGFATQEEFERIDEEIQAIVNDSVAFADESPTPAVSSLYDDIYADPVEEA